MFFDRVLDNFHNQFQYVHGKNYLGIGEQLSAYFRHLGLSKTGQGQNTNVLVVLFKQVIHMTNEVRMLAL